MLAAQPDQLLVQLAGYEGTDLSDGRSLITGFIVADSPREIAIIGQKIQNALGEMLEKEQVVDL